MAASQLRLFAWDSGTTLAPLIIPVRSKESPENAAFRYLYELAHDPCLLELFEGTAPQIPLRGFHELSSIDWEPRLLMIANLPQDYGMQSGRIIGFQNVFQSAQQKSFILPINANLGLCEQETLEFFKLISEHFPFMIAMGGDDVDPALYKTQNSHCRKISPTRDQFEYSLVQNYIAEEKGFLLGVCRGSQLASVALGYELIQDLPHHIGTTVSHANDWHPVEIIKTSNNILGSIISEEKKLIVNSIHHQSVVFKEGGPLVIAAVAEDGVTEATEFKNGRGLLIQSHPELMNNDLGSKILLTALAQKKCIIG